MKRLRSRTCEGRLAAFQQSPAGPRELKRYALAVGPIRSAVGSEFRDAQLSKRRPRSTAHFAYSTGQAKTLRQQGDESPAEHLAIALERTEMTALKTSGRIDAQRDIGDDRAAANTTAIALMTPTPYFPAAKKAGIPSIIGDDPRINSNAVRAVVLWLWTCCGGSATSSGVTSWDVAPS